MKKPRKRGILYARHFLSTPKNLMTPARTLARRLRFVVEDEVIEGNLKQPRLKKLLKSKNVKVVVAPSLFHFTSADQLPRLILEAHRNDIELVFARENLRLRGRDRDAAMILEFLKRLEEARLYARSVSIRQSLLVARLIAGKRIGRTPIENSVRERIVKALQNGKSYRTTAQELGVSKGLVQKVAGETRLRPSDREDGGLRRRRR